MIKLPFSNMLPCGVCDFSCIGKFIECRAKERIPENSKSVIVYLFPYFLGDEYYKNSNISKYAVPEDYHIVAEKYLCSAVGELKVKFPEGNFQWFCDNSPVNEVEAAVRCGLGVKGRNGLLINERYGSFCFIGEIVTDVVLPFSVAEDSTCLNCRLCEKACPGGALEGYRVNVNQCLSHITQKKGVLSEEQGNLIKKNGCIWGCDACQNSCPMNKNAEKTPVKEFYETACSRYETGDDISTRAFNWRGEAVIKRNFEISSCK